eukprot:364282-Chlamydomonas_euryale.AAC.25
MSDGADGHNADEHLDYEAELASQLAEQKEALEGIDAALEAEPSEELQEVQQMPRCKAMGMHGLACTPMGMHGVACSGFGTHWACMHALARLSAQTKQFHRDLALAHMKSALEAAITELQAALLEFKRAKLLAAVSAAFDRERQHSAGESMPSTSGRTHSSFSVGDACRFLGDDGRWYEGRVAALHQDGHAGVEYRVPTRCVVNPLMQRGRAGCGSALMPQHQQACPRA